MNYIIKSENTTTVNDRNKKNQSQFSLIKELYWKNVKHKFEEV